MPNLSRQQSQLVDKWRRMGHPDLEVSDDAGTGQVKVKFRFPKIIVTVNKDGKTDQGTPYSD